MPAGPASGARHDRGPGSRCRFQLHGWASPRCSCRLTDRAMIGRLVASLRAGGAGRSCRDRAAGSMHPRAQPSRGGTTRRGRGRRAAAARPASMRDSIELGLRALARQDPPRSRRVDARRLSRDHGRDRRRAHGIRGQDARPHRHSMPQRPAGPSDRLTLGDCGPDSIALLPAWASMRFVAGHRDSVIELEIARPEIITDLDTPDDLQQWVQRQNSRRGSPTQSQLTIPDSRFRERTRTLRHPAPGFACAFGCSLWPRIGPGSRILRSSWSMDRRFATCEPRSGRIDPALAPLLSTAMIAVDEEYASDDTPILPGSRLAVIPPVSGGAGSVRSTADFPHDVP